LLSQASFLQEHFDMPVRSNSFRLEIKHATRNLIIRPQNQRFRLHINIHFQTADVAASETLFYHRYTDFHQMFLFGA
jgi:hypothetical protein